MAVPRERAGSPAGLFVAMLRDREMRRILALYGLIGAADAAGMGNFLFCVEIALALPRWGSTLLLLPAVLPLVTLPLWARVSRRIGKQRTLLLAYAPSPGPP